MSDSALDAFVASMRNPKTGKVMTTVQELRENQFGLPLAHYSQQYLYGATGLRIQTFNSIQGPNEAGKSSLLYDFLGYVAGAPEDGGLGGISVLYELEQKISPTILHSIISRYGERTQMAVMLKLGLTLEEAFDDLNKNVIPTYKKIYRKYDKPLFVGFDSIGGAASQDTIEKLQQDGVAGKGFWNKQHFMKYFCENQGAIFVRDNIPVVVMCINQEREQVSTTPGRAFAPPKKTITGGKAQLFKDGHMLSVTKQALASKDGNLVFLKTSKTSYCDPRSISVQFRWNKFGKQYDDAYEAKFLWARATAEVLANPEKGVGELRDICHVSIDKEGRVTCPQLDIKSEPPSVFEEALMADEKLLDQLYTFQKIEKLKDLISYSEYRKSAKSKSDEPEQESEEEAPKKKPKARGGLKSTSKTKSKAKEPEPEPLTEDALELLTDVEEEEIQLQEHEDCGEDE